MRQRLFLIMNSVQRKELDDARHGTLFFLGNLNVCRDSSFDTGLISNFSSGTSIVADLQTGAGLILSSCDAGKKLVDGYDKIKAKIKEALASFFDAVAEKMAALYGEATAALEWVAEFGTWAVSTFTGSLADLVPGWGYVQAASDLYDGVKKAVTKAIAWLGQVFSGWGVKLLEGGPSVMARSIAQHNVAGLAGGLKDIAITSCKVGLRAAGDAAGGVGSIVGAVTGILQRIANLIEYSVQRFLLARTINQARYQWENKAEMMGNHLRFNEWFSRSCALTPVVAALTLCSGNVGHPNRFLQLITPDYDVVSQEEFDKGVKHIEHLKTLSRDYVREYVNGYHLKITSESDYVSGMLSKIFN